jgi:hypothetical protein
MLALLASQAMLGALRGRSMASPNQSGSTAPALHRVGAQIPDMRHKIFAPNRSLVVARHSGRATRDPESRGKNLDSRLRGNDGQDWSPFLLPC